MISVLTAPTPVIKPLDIVGPKDRDGFALHAAPQAIQHALSRAYANHRQLDRAIAWLEELNSVREAQQAAGTWPPIACPCEFHQRHQRDRESLTQPTEEAS